MEGSDQTPMEQQHQPLAKWLQLPSTQFFSIVQQWDELNAANLNQGVLSACFVQALIDEFASDKLIILCKYVDEKLTFAGMFEPANSKANARWQIFQPSQGPLGVLVAQRNSLDRQLIDEVAKQLPGHPYLLDLTQIDSSGFVQSDTKLDYSYYITTGALVLPTDFDSYFASLSKNTRQNVNKAKNRLKKEELTISLEIITAPNEMQDYVALYGELESKGWKNDLGTAVNINNEQGRFYVDMLESMAKKGQAQVWCYRFGDHLVAIDLCIVHQQTLTILKTTFDENFARYSPALLLKLDAYKALSEQGIIKRIEYYGKVMDWHKRLTCEQREIFHITWAKNQAIYRALTWLKQKLINK